MVLFQINPTVFNFLWINLIACYVKTSISARNSNPNDLLNFAANAIENHVPFNGKQYYQTGSQPVQFHHFEFNDEEESDHQFVIHFPSQSHQSPQAPQVEHTYHQPSQSQPILQYQIATSPLQQNVAPLQQYQQAAKPSHIQFHYDQAPFQQYFHQVQSQPQRPQYIQAPVQQNAQRVQSQLQQPHYVQQYVQQTPQVQYQHPHNQPQDHLQDQLQNQLQNQSQSPPNKPQENIVVGFLPLGEELRRPPGHDAPSNGNGTQTIDGLSITTQSSLIPINCLKSLCG